MGSLQHIVRHYPGRCTMFNMIKAMILTKPVEDMAWYDSMVSCREILIVVASFGGANWCVQLVSDYTNQPVIIDRRA